MKINRQALYCHKLKIAVCFVSSFHERGESLYFAVLKTVLENRKTYFDL